MERTTILPYEWFNKMVRMSAYSGEERRSEIDSEGISEPQHVMVRDYVGRLVNADETGLLLVLRGGKSLFLSASAVLSVTRPKSSIGGWGRGRSPLAFFTTL